MIEAHRIIFPGELQASLEREAGETHLIIEAVSWR